MNAVDQIIVQAHRQNPILGALLGVLMDGGRIVSTSDSISELLSMVPDVFFFEQSQTEALSDYDFRDLIFLDKKTSIDLLWKISHQTGAQLALFSDIGSDESLCDFLIEEKDLRSALMQIRPLYEQLKSFKGQVYFDGSRLNKGLFLDRDGVVIEDGEYLQNPDDIKLNKGMVPVIKRAKELGYRLFIVSNQSGIGRGMFNLKSYEKVTDRLLELLAHEGIVIDRVLKAPYFENSQYASGLVRKSLRKPRPGMIHSVVSEFRIDISQSMMVGDKASDLMAGAVAGVPRLFLIESKQYPHEFDAWSKWPLRSRFEENGAVSSVGSIDQLLKFFDRWV